MLFYSIDKVEYEGDFIDDEFEGNGKYYQEDGKYYIGQFKKGKPCGYGKEYDKNGKLVYEGKFVDGKSDKDCLIF